jgi:peptide/nickel transport system substrate-binding protein
MKKFSPGLLCIVAVVTLWVPMALASDGTLVIGRPSDAISLDSNTETTGPGAVVYSNIIEPLIVIDKDGKVQPNLAEKFEVVSPDRIRFFIRKGIKFHDGTDLNAAAVKFTFDRAITMPARWKALFGPLKAAEIVDDYTVDIVTEVPYGPLMASMAMVYTGIVSPAAVEKYGENYGRNPVGTGPFMFKEWKTKDHITLVRNDNYWGTKALSKEVIFKVIPEAGSRMMALRTGDIDIAMQPTPAELDLFRADKNFRVAETMGLRVFFLGFNNARFPTDDPKVRQALSMAVDVNGLVENILEGSAVPPKGYLAPAVFGFKDMELDKKFPYDPEKAKALLAEAGWKDTDNDGILDKDGKKLVINFLGAKGRYLMDAEVCEAAQAMFKTIGVEAKLDFFEWATTFTALRKPDLEYNLFTLGWLTTNADADYSLYAMFHSSQFSPKGWNNNRFKDARVDTLLDTARSSQDRAERLASYHEAQDIIAESATWIPIYNTKEIFVLNSKVQGFEPNPSEYLLPLKGVSIK